MVRALSGLCPFYALIGIKRKGDRIGATGARLAGPREIQETITIFAPRPKVYAAWRNLSQLPHFSPHLKKVESTSGRRSHWEAQIGHRRIIWDADILEERENELLRWRSLPDADFPHTGFIEFRDSPVGATVVRVYLRFQQPGGRLGEAAGSRIGMTIRQEVAESLKNFKHTLEVLEIKAENGSFSPP